MFHTIILFHSVISTPQILLFKGIDHDTNNFATMQQYLFNFKFFFGHIFKICFDIFTLFLNYGNNSIQNTPASTVLISYEGKRVLKRIQLIIRERYLKTC